VIIFLSDLRVLRGAMTFFLKESCQVDAPLEQIQLTLEHASLKTTERYLGILQDLTDAACDRLGLRI